LSPHWEEEEEEVELAAADVVTTFSNSVWRVAMKWTKFPLRTLLSASGVVLLLLGTAGLGYGDPITSITDLQNFRDTRSLNDVGLGQGDRIVYGANVVPNGSAGTMIAATQGAFRNPATGYYPCGGFTTLPNQCTLSSAFDPALTGQWSLEFINGGDTATAVTPLLTPDAAAAPVPFPVNVTISGNGTAPTLSWTIPAGFTPDAFRVQVWDKNPQGVPDVIFSTNLPPNATSFTIPDTVNLSFGTPYVLGIQLIRTRDGTAGTGSPNSNISKRSNSFFDFTPLSGGPPNVYLPNVGQAPDPGSGYGATYQFSITNILSGETVFIDPYLAVGYDYAIGAGDPNFASVVLPAVQSNPFLLSFPGKRSPVFVNGNVEYVFPHGGVSSFSVRRINPSANLDPGNVTAFITGLKFTGPGNFTGTMTPVIVPQGILYCAGFQPPADKAITVKQSKVIPLKAEIFDNDGNAVVGGDPDVPTPPAINVSYQPQTGPATDVTAGALPRGAGMGGTQFEFLDGLWQYNLKTTNYSSPGTYTVTMVPGDTTYSISNTCTATFVIN
jgi:hypothetical protein